MVQTIVNDSSNGANENNNAMRSNGPAAAAAVSTSAALRVSSVSASVVSSHRVWPSDLLDIVLSYVHCETIILMGGTPHLDEYGRYVGSMDAWYINPMLHQQWNRFPSLPAVTFRGNAGVIQHLDDSTGIINHTLVIAPASINIMILNLTDLTHQSNAAVTAVTASTADATVSGPRRPSSAHWTNMVPVAAGCSIKYRHDGGAGCNLIVTSSPIATNYDPDTGATSVNRIAVDPTGRRCLQQQVHVFGLPNAPFVTPSRHMVAHVIKDPHVPWFIRPTSPTQLQGYGALTEYHDTINDIHGYVVCGWGVQKRSASSICQVYNCVTNDWDTKLSSMIHQRSEASAVTLPNGNIVVLGGLRDEPGKPDVIELYSMVDKKWVETPWTLPIPHLRDFSVIYVDGIQRVVLIGGRQPRGEYGAGGVATIKCWQLNVMDPSSNWQPFISLPKPRAGASVAAW